MSKNTGLYDLLKVDMTTWQLVWFWCCILASIIGALVLVVSAAIATFTDPFWRVVALAGLIMVVGSKQIAEVILNRIYKVQATE